MRCQVIPIDLRLRREFSVAGGKATVKRNHIFAIDDIGLGEAAGSVHYGITSDEIEKELNIIRNELEKTDYDRVPEYLSNQSSRFSSPVLCAVSTAWHDLRGKRSKKELSELLGLERIESIKSSFTASLNDIKGLKNLTQGGYDLIKIKMDASKFGLDDIIKLLRNNKGVKVRIDANGSWTYETALEIIERFPENNIELIEQPFGPDAVNDWKRLKEYTDIPLIMDEGIGSPEDVKNIAPYVDGVNIKIQKSGLLETALSAMRAAGDLGLKVMLGCMIETSVGIAAACHLAGAADYCDLDGRWLIEGDPFAGLTYKNQMPVITGKYGHGVIFG